ncbi:MAG: DUF3990 domain-containing protein [Defluviitaleaceae bacterium]|nr:DUF3990 domain-containing protein [Defluviitaleaceae bacterium]
MELYHGTTQIIREIDLTKGRHRTDFGQGFYLGSNLDVAQRWAQSRAAFSGKPVVMKYTLAGSIFSDEKVNPLIFDEPTLEWLNFVRDNRRKGKPDDRLRHAHGIVRGSIANDKVNFVVEDYIKGKITADVAITRVKALPNVQQVSLHTFRALAYLDATDFWYQEQLPNGEWSKWVSLSE